MGDYSYVPQQLKIGDLKGNRFALGLRLVHAVDEEVIKNNIEGLTEKGFINYYGLQRFGVTNVKTHTIGREVLKKNWKAAVELILSANDLDLRADEVKKAFLQNYDFKEALKKLPHKNKLERILIEGLKHQGSTNYRNAFMCLPRFIRELYGHAYQSYIWNKAVSRRLAQYGKEPIVGDMILLTQDDIDIEDDDLDIDVLPVDQVAEEATEEKELTKETSEVLENKRSETVGRARFDPSKVTILTEETKNNYKLEDIIVPLPGRDVPLPPNNPITDIIQHVLQEDGLSLEDFVKSDLDVFFRGGFRKMIVKPDSVEWDVVRYNVDELDLQNVYYFTEPDPAGVPDGKYQAIRFKFNLPKSAYATMCVRELTKNSTSFNAQIKLNEMLTKEANKDKGGQVTEGGS